MKTVLGSGPAPVFSVVFPRALSSRFPGGLRRRDATTAFVAAAVFAVLLHCCCYGFRAASCRMAKNPGESKIPVLHTTNQQLRSRFSSISNKVRSHLDGSYRSSSPSVLFGLFGTSPGVDPNKAQQPAARPSSLFKSPDRAAAEKDFEPNRPRVEPNREHAKTAGVLRYFERPNFVVVGGGGGGNDKIESELCGYDDGCCGGGGGGGSAADCCSWDIAKTESPFECTDSLGILTPDQMLEFRGDEIDCEVPGLFFKTSPHQMTDCISDGDVTMNDLEAVSMPKDDDLVSPALSSDPSNRTVSEHDSASAYPKRSTVSFGNVFYDNFTIDRTPSVEDLPMDDLSSKTTTEVPPTNTPSINTVITSITSVGSLDTGYQGDGETSRPTSRGATVKRLGPTEPMTDSDFFTESEAEDHCHRRARVIDGTLYSGDNNKPETQPDSHKSSETTVEEMDSSGVYSDFDKIFEEPAPPAAHKDSSEAVSSNNSTSPSSVNSQQIRSTEVDQPSFCKTVLETSEDASSPASKRCKRPTSATKPKTLDVRQDQENRAPRTRKPASRWDAVMNKIEKSKTDQKSRVNRLKDVKSKINSINLLPTPYTSRLKESPTNSEPLPVRSPRENTPLKAKSRRTRVRGGSDTNLPMSDQLTNSPRPRCIPKSSQNSSRDSSFSDLSGETKITLKQAISHPSLANKNGCGARVSPSSVNVVTPTVRRPAAVTSTPSKRSPQNRRLNLDHNLTATTTTTIKPDGNQKATSQNSPPQVVKTMAAASGPAQAARVKVAKKDGTAVAVDRHRQHQPRRDAERLQRAENQLRHVTKGFDAVSVLLQYLVDDMDALSTAKLKQQLDANHDDLVSTKLLLDESQAKCVQYREDVDRLRKENETYRIDLDAKEKLVVEIASSKETEVRELEKKLREQADRLRAQFDEELSKLKNESEAEKMKLILSHDQKVVELQQTNKTEVCQAQKSAAEKQAEFARKVLALENERDRLESERDALKEENQRLLEDKKLQNTSLGYQKLCNETESLRTVLELKSAEMQELRKQNEQLQREADELPAIIQKYEAAQSRVEDLNVQLQRKSEIEMQLSLEKDKMAREIYLEKQKKKRLSCHNEELQWKLKKSTEVANHLAVTTKRLSQTPQDLAAMREARINYQKLCRESSNSDNSGDDDAAVTWRSEQLEADAGAPARIMGVMKKNDSLSYVFEVEEEPSAIATRLVRRASSLRSVGKCRDGAGGGPTSAKKRSRASSQSGSSVVDSAAAAAAADRCSSGDCCYTCSSEDCSSNSSSPEHTVYGQNPQIADAEPSGSRKTGDGDDDGLAA